LNIDFYINENNNRTSSADSDNNNDNDDENENVALSHIFSRWVRQSKAFGTKRAMAHICRQIAV